jgi:hypothetical protein
MALRKPLHAVAVAAILLVAGLIVMGACTHLPQDDAGARPMHFDHLRDTLYAEVFLIGGNAIAGHFKAGIYNTTGLNDETNGRDSAPQALVARLDTKAIKDRFGVLGAFVNGPRIWTLDWIDVRVGKGRDFGGLRMRWVMWLDVPKGLLAKGVTPYTQITGNRDTNFGFDAGKPVFVLDDPEGHAWVMKSISLMKDPQQRYENLQDLGERLHLPSGWRFRVKVLDRDLVLTPAHGRAVITQDDLGNTYDRTGPPYSNYKP